MQEFENPVWIFHGVNAQFAGAVFTKRDIAERWIAEHNLSGILTKYPLNVGVYNWAIDNGTFKPKTEDHTASEFIGSFTSASPEHYHYENGSAD